MRNGTNLRLLCCIAGMVLCVSAGEGLVLVCLRPAGANETNSTPGSQAVGAVVRVRRQLVLPLLAFGGLLGSLTCLTFERRPRQHYALIGPQPKGLLARVRPRSWAEATVAHRMGFLGIAASLAFTLWVLPRLVDTDVLEHRALGIRVVLAAMFGLTASVPILPVSLLFLSGDRIRNSRAPCDQEVYAC